MLGCLQVSCQVDTPEVSPGSFCTVLAVGLRFGGGGGVVGGVEEEEGEGDAGCCIARSGKLGRARSRLAGWLVNRIILKN